MPAHTKTAKSNAQFAVIGIDIGKNVFHLIGLDSRGAIVLKCKLSRSQLENRLANTPPCLIGMEACAFAGASRKNKTGGVGRSPLQSCQIAALPETGAKNGARRSRRRY